MHDTRGVGRIAEAESPANPRDHLVSFYESEAFLVDSTVGFLAPVLDDGEAACVIATGDHREAIEAGLAAAGVRLDEARRAGRLAMPDAAELLSRFMVDGRPDRHRFLTIGADLLARLGGRGHPWLYGEMVALLWQRGDVPGALALETLWNELAAAHRFTLLCGYPLQSVDGEERTPAFRSVCQQHSAVLPSESYTRLTALETEPRAVALLEQEAIAGIHARVALRRRQHELQEELVRLQALERLRHQFMISVVHDLHGAVGGPVTGERGVASLHKTATRQVRRVLRARDCRFVPADDVVTRSSRASQAGIAVLVPVSTSDTGHGVLVVEFDATRQVDADELRFLSSVAEVLAAAHDHHAAQQTLAHRALHDPLTGLPNRTLLMDRLDQALRRRARSGEQVAVLFADLDHFKPINDDLGHSAGDQLLIAVATRLRESVRPGDTVARLGGDEFAMVCAAVEGPEDAHALAERLRESLSAPVQCDGCAVSVRASVGVAVAVDGDDAEGVLRRADLAMYQAKLRGRDQCALWVPDPLGVVRAAPPAAQL